MRKKKEREKDEQKEIHATHYATLLNNFVSFVAIPFGVSISAFNFVRVSIFTLYNYFNSTVNS